METKQFFHVCANGAETRNFIIKEADFIAAFNLMGVCAANTDATVISFSIEESHPHALLWGTEIACSTYRDLFDNQYRHYAAATRPRGADIFLHCELFPIGNDEDYLKNVAVYTIIQPTKDGKPVMYHDYRWGTGSMYFRNEFYTPVWYYDNEGTIKQPVRFDSYTYKEKRRIVHSRNLTIPDNWLICNGLILPSNYINTKLFEHIFKTHNRFRVFTASPRSREEEMKRKMADYTGVMVDDLEGRRLCGDICKQLFGTRDPRRLDTLNRISLAQRLRKEYRLSFRQLATLVRLAETEIRCHIL